MTDDTSSVVFGLFVLLAITTPVWSTYDVVALSPVPALWIIPSGVCYFPGLFWPVCASRPSPVTGRKYKEKKVTDPVKLLVRLI